MPIMSLGVAPDPAVNAPRPTFRRSLTFAGQALQKACPPVSAFGRSFFRVGFLAWLNVPFTVSAHPFVARQCSSTALLQATTRPRWTPESDESEVATDIFNVR